MFANWMNVCSRIELCLEAFDVPLRASCNSSNPQRTNTFLTLVTRFCYNDLCKNKVRKFNELDSDLSGWMLMVILFDKDVIWCIECLIYVWHLQ